MQPKPSLMARLKYEIGVLLGLPDDARGWILRSAWTARNIISHHRPAIIVSSGPPHSAHLSAWFATRLRSITWIIDFRDPWAGPFSDAWAETPVVKSFVARTTANWLERLVVRSATLVVCNTREFAEKLAIKYPDARIEHVPNAVDRELLPVVTESPYEGLGIVHVGTIYGGRDLGPVLLALSTLFEQRPEARSDGTRIRIAGNIEEPYATTLRQDIEELGLTEFVEFLGLLNRTSALRLVGRSRLAVVLAQHQELQVPAKLYEMVGMGVPTVVITELDSATASEARRLGAAVVAPEDVETLTSLMRRLWTEVGSVGTATFGEVDYQQMARRVSALLATPTARIRPAAMSQLEEGRRVAS